MPANGIFHEDLIKAHVHSVPQKNSKGGLIGKFLLHDLKSELVAWYLTWLRDNEVSICGVNKDPILLFGFHGIEFILRFVWSVSLDGSTQSLFPWIFLSSR